MIEICTSPPSIPYSQAFSPQSESRNSSDSEIIYPELVPFRIGEIYPIYKEIIYFTIHQGKRQVLQSEFQIIEADDAFLCSQGTSSFQVIKSLLAM